jgi:putative alpha-1,2-mannosidase
VIVTRNNSAEDFYIQSAKLNGEPLNQFWFPHTNLVSGGTLEIELGSKRGTWGTGSSPMLSP